jgi:hypothetical protein
MPGRDGNCGLRGSGPARPARRASYPVAVRQVAILLHASFRQRLATPPLRFANPAPPSGWVEDFHLQAVKYARHTRSRGNHRTIPPDLRNLAQNARFPHFHSRSASLSSRRTSQTRARSACGAQRRLDTRLHSRARYTRAQAREQLRGKRF